MPTKRLPKRLCAALPLLALAACVPAPQPTPAPASPPAPAPAPSAAPAPVAPAPPPPSVDWTEAPITPGDWRWRRSGAESIAEFLSPQGQLVFAVACTGQDVYLSRVGGTGPMTVRTETTERTLPASPSGMFVRAPLAPRDPLLDAIAFSKGRFAVEAAGAPALYMPPYPEITRAIEDCR